MQVAYCENCGKHTGHKRAVGIIGKVTALATLGANYLAYTPRCVICGLTAAEARSVSLAGQAKREAHSASLAVQAKREAQQQKEAKAAEALVKLPFQTVALVFKALYAFSYWASVAITEDYRDPN